MLGNTRRKLDAASRIRDFHRANPFSDPNQVAVATKFGELVDTARALAVEEDGGRRGAAAAVKLRRTLRREASEQLRLIAAVGSVAAQAEPALVGKFLPPTFSDAYARFLARAFALLTEARAAEATLSAHGLPQGAVERLGAVLTRLEAESEQVSLHRRAHVGAHASLNSTSHALMELGNLLDALNRDRYRSDPKQLAAWESARNVVTKVRGAPVAPEGPAPSGPELGRAA